MSAPDAAGALDVPATRRRRPRFGDGPVALDGAVALMSTANRAFSVAVVAALYEVHHSASLVAVAAATRYGAGLLASSFILRLFGGVNPRKLLIGTNIVCFLVALGLAAAARGDDTAGLVIALSAVLRAAAAPAPVASAAMLPSVLGDRDLADVMRRQNAVDKLALMLGPAIGGVILLAVSAATELFIVGWLFAIAAALSMLLPTVRPSIRRPARGSGGRAAVEESERGEGRRSAGPVLWFSAFSVGAGLLYGIDTVLFAVVASDRLNLSGSGYGLLFAGLGVGGAAAALVARRTTRRTGLATYLVAALVIYGVPTIALAWVSGIGVAMVVEAVRGFGALLVEIIVVTELQRVLLPTRVPSVVARVSAFVAGAVAIGASITPALLHAFGLRSTLILAGTVVPVAGLLLLPWIARADGALAARSDALAPRTAVLGALGLLRGVSFPTIEILATDLAEVDVPDGTVLIREGEASDDFYVVVAGEVTATAADSRTLRSMGPGEWFGEIAALSGSARTATVTATATSHLYRISGLAFQQALTQLPASSTLLESASARLGTTHPTLEPSWTSDNR